MGTTLATDATMVVVMCAGTGTDAANACIDSTVGVNITTVTNVTSNTTTIAPAVATNVANKSMEEDCAQVPMFEDATADSGRLPDVVAQSKLYGAVEDEPLESYLAITIQVFIPFLIAGLGMVGAGLVLDSVQVRAPIVSIYLLSILLLFITDPFAPARILRTVYRSLTFFLRSTGSCSRK